MPPKLNLQRATVHPEFIEVMIALYAEWIQRNMKLIEAGKTRSGFANYTHSAIRMLPIIQRVSDGRKGLDYELTRLRGLSRSYTEFTVIHDIDPTHHFGEPDWDEDDANDFYDREYARAPKIPWLVGRTRHVTMTNYANRQEIKGQLGCFNVYIPSSIVRSPELDHIHMIPHRNMRSIYRHPHHYVSNDGPLSPRRSPLSYRTGNCYGDYSEVIKAMIDEPDFPALFQQLFGHLSTFGYGPPIHLESLDYDIHTPEK